MASRLLSGQLRSRLFEVVDLMNEVNKISIEQCEFGPLFTNEVDCFCGCEALFDEY
jgi:hypothetical protein